MTEHYKRGMDVGDIAAKFGVQRPAVWKALRRTGHLPAYKTAVPGNGGRPKGGGQAGYTKQRRQKSIAARTERAGQMPAVDCINRDPCFKCGVRGDIGCKHRRGKI